MFYSNSGGHLDRIRKLHPAALKINGEDWLGVPVVAVEGKGLGFKVEGKGLGFKVRACL